MPQKLADNIMFLIYWLQGYVLGNPLTDSEKDENSRVLFAYLKALISEELYQVKYTLILSLLVSFMLRLDSGSSDHSELFWLNLYLKLCLAKRLSFLNVFVICIFCKSMKRNCRGDYINVDLNNTLCVDDLELYNEVSGKKINSLVSASNFK